MPCLHPGRRAWLIASAFSLLTLTQPALAQASYPDRQISLIVPSTAGGVVDNLARYFAQELSQQLGQTIVIENLGGASGMLAANRVMRAKPDGYTLLFGTTSDMVVAPLAVAETTYRAQDFTPIIQVGLTPMALVAHPNLKLESADALATLARQRPGTLSVGVTGSTSLQAFAIRQLEQAAQIELLPVPYKGGSQIITDLLGGQIDLAVLSLPGALPLVRNGSVTLMGVLSDQRTDVAPELPTIQESADFPGVRSEIWAALAGPPDLPAPIVERLSAAARIVIESPTFMAQRAQSGDTAVPFISPADLSAFIQAEDARYRALVTHQPAH